MGYTSEYAATEPARTDVERWDGLTVLEFGTPWCGFCTGAQPLVETALARRDDVRHVKVEDGRGRPLGRAFGVKLWPTLVLLRDGVEVARVVRPALAGQVEGLFEAVDA